MTQDPIRIAIVGCGFGAKIALPVYREMAEFQPIAVWSRTAARAEDVASTNNLELGSSDIEEILDWKGLDAVHVACPVMLQEEFAIKAASRGLHVLCEKPFGSSLEAGLRIAEALADAGVVGMVDFELRMTEARRHLIERALACVGKVRFASISVVLTDHSSVDSRKFSWVNDAALGGGRLLAYGVHDLDLLLALDLQPISVAALCDIGVERRRNASGFTDLVTAEDAFSILMELAAGGIAAINFTSTAHHGRGESIEIYGDGGTARLTSEGYLESGVSGEELLVEGPFDHEFGPAFQRVAQKFSSAVHGEADPDPAVSEALSVRAIADAVQLAADERRWVAVSGFDLSKYEVSVDRP